MTLSRSPDSLCLQPALEATRVTTAGAPVADPVAMSAARAMMGGTVGVHLYPTAAAALGGSTGQDAERLLDRIEAWAARLTRFSGTSDLARVNATPSSRVHVRPILAEVLDWGREAHALSDGIVDVALLDARLAVEGTALPPTEPVQPPTSDRSWSLARGPRGSELHRPIGLRFDLDGVAKGWLADRALLRSVGYPSAIIDADGDIAIRLEHGREVRFGVADPRATGALLGELNLRGPRAPGSRAYGLATSGTTVHRWTVAGRASHHLVDPRTGLPARTDVVQATVLADTARQAEAIAKTVVILGSGTEPRWLDRPEVHGAILLTDRGDLFVTQSIRRWLS